MPEARIRVAALHLAGARALPLLCLGIGGGLQSRLVHHARSALKQQKSSSAPRAAPANASLRLPSSQQLALRQVASKSRSTHRRRRQKRRTNPCKYSIRYRTRQKISVYGQTLASSIWATATRPPSRPTRPVATNAGRVPAGGSRCAGRWCRYSESGARAALRLSASIPPR